MFHAKIPKGEVHRVATPAQHETCSSSGANSPGCHETQKKLELKKQTSGLSVGMMKFPSHMESHEINVPVTTSHCLMVSMRRSKTKKYWKALLELGSGNHSKPQTSGIGSRKQHVLCL